MKLLPRIAAFTVTSLLTACASEPVPPLPKLMLDPARVGVAGFSSGAYMAQQVHLAYSDRLIGAELLAGGPYHCAETSLQRALGVCLRADPAVPDVAALAVTTRQRAERGEIASLDGLAGDRVLVMHGTADRLVAESVTRASQAIYEQLGGSRLNIEGDFDAAFAHVFPTESSGGDCATTAAPYIGRCNIDGAARMLQTIFGPASRAAGSATGTLLPFDQNALQAPQTDAQLDDAGLIYQPAQCGEAGRCGLLIVFHGCEQNAGSVEQAFARDAGFNRWADVYDLVVLYPQTRSSYVPLNPKACWDWWGFTGAEYDTRNGVQLRWVANAAAALGVPLDSR
jgi:poly(3-hydroxybutyrate) depolymerase